MAHRSQRTPSRASVAAHVRTASSEDFGEAVYRQLKNAPWVMGSLGAHAVVFAIFAMLPQEAPPVERARVAHADPAADLPPELAPEPPPEVPEVRPFSESERPATDDPLQDAVDELTQTDDAVPSEEPLGDPRFTSQAPFEGAGDNGVIGTGGGAGGRFGRGPGGRAWLRASISGSARSGAVDLALEWLKRHQSPDGRWDADGFDAQCKRNKCSGPGESVYDPGLTGLALLCFLGAGETHQSGTCKETVREGLKYLRNVQDTEGCFGPRTSQHFQYNHLCASLAMTEAYGMTQSHLFRSSAQRGIDFIHQSQNPYLAWRYGVRDGDNDTSVTGWAVMALKSGILAELEVDKGAFGGAMAWVDKMTEPEFGKVGYQTRGGPPARTTAMQQRFPATESESMTAVGALSRIFCHAGRARTDEEADAALRGDAALAKGVDLMLKKLPEWDIDSGRIDFYYWYYGSLAMHQVGGDAWRRWNAALEKAVVPHQRTEADRDERGSWDPEDPWSPEGGRVYATAINCLTMEVLYRYARVTGSR